jgi:hypothetical protein
MVSLDQAAREANAREVFMTLLKRFTTNNRPVSSMKSSTFGPALFAREDEAKRAGCTSKVLEAAMRQLFKDDVIWNAPFGPPSKQRFHIAIK